MKYKQIFFLFFILSLFILQHILFHYNVLQDKKAKIIYLLSTCLLVLFVGYYTDPSNSKECFTSLSARNCTYGAYMWNGNGPISKYCKNLISTQEGQEKIKKESCGPECKGRPLPKFE